MYDFNKCLKYKSTNWGNHTQGISLQKEDMMQMGNNNCQPKLARVITLTNPPPLFINPTTYTSSMFCDPMFPARKAYSADSANTVFGR